MRLQRLRSQLYIPIDATRTHARVRVAPNREDGGVNAIPVPQIHSLSILGGGYHPPDTMGQAVMGAASCHTFLTLACSAHVLVPSHGLLLSLLQHTGLLLLSADDRLTLQHGRRGEVKGVIDDAVLPELHAQHLRLRM